MLHFNRPVLLEKFLIDSSNSDKGHFHQFHLVRPSYAPVFCALSAFFLVLSAVSYFHSKALTVCVLTSLFLLISGMIVWWQEVVEESYVYHTNAVRRGLRLGFILFIVSEIMFFFGFFWGFFHSSLSPSVFIGGVWPPPGIEPFNPWTVPLANTLILLLSGCSITWAHHSFLSNPKASPYTLASDSEVRGTRTAFFTTLVLAACFTCLQLLEYCEAPFSISDSVYGSTFFMMTGFHGLHVIIGTIFITVCFVRFLYGRLTINQHLGFEFAAWYWHFVDVVWLFLFVSVYWWGGSLFDASTGFGTF